MSAIGERRTLPDCGHDERFEIRWVESRPSCKVHVWICVRCEYERVIKQIEAERGKPV